MKLKKAAAWAAGIVVAVIAVAAIVIAAVWGREIGTIASVEQVDADGYLYRMDYKARYDLDEIIGMDIDSNAKLLDYVVSKVGKGIRFKLKSSQVAEEGEKLKAFSCTSFQARKAEGDGFFYGRNYDYYKNPTMVTYSRPKDGYASIACSDMSHFGYSLEKLPKDLKSKLLCIASIYAPVDGMNEKGLCTSIMALPHQASQQNTGKHAVGTTILMRLFLDRCATVAEALELVASLDVRHDAAVGSGYHYMVADANGDCAVIEFDKDEGWKTLIVRKEEGKNWMHVTNHLLSPKYYTTVPDIAVGNPNSHSWWRYETVGKFLEDHDGVLSLDQAQECLAEVHWVDLLWPDGTIEDTQYSNIYDQQELVLHLRNWNEYDTTRDFALFPYSVK